jgi:hypothetical protein
MSSSFACDTLTKKSDLLITSKREKIDKVVGLMLLNSLPV